jgi:hypothetical protein
MDGGVERTLRAKYLDWCSARITERFLALEPEEIYAKARPAESAEAGRSTSESYRVLVQRVTESLLAEMSLPAFEEWSRAYGADPSRYDEEMVGFWKDPSGGGASTA